MADSTSLKAQKSGEKLKYSNMINRTTSESIRIHDSDKIPNHPTSLSATSTTPRKKTSFQITSVTVGGHPSNDGGDDSADDLDESHAEDNSDVIDTSRATDLEIETPSYSEDTFSKDDVFFNSSTSLGTAPVIPTSSQYGLAIVSTPEGCSNILNSNVPGGNNSSGSDIHVNVTDNVINLGIVGGKHLEGDMRDLHSHTSRNERFKVVKIESTEPFKRGRWMCMDYLDHTMSQQQQLQNQGSGPGTGTNAARGVETNDSSNTNQCPNADSGISMADQPNTISTIDDYNNTDYSTSVGSNSTAQSDQQNLIPHSVAVVTVQNSVSPGQTMQFSVHGGNMVHQAMNVSQPQTIQQQAQSLTSLNNQHTMIGTNQHQSLQPQQIQQVLSATNMHSQSTSMTSQQIQQPNQQLQHQGIPIQHVHQIHQPQAPISMVPQQYQPQIQQIHHQAVQQNAQAMLQQQASMSQHMQQQPVHHQHNIQLQQQINQGQIPVQVAQAVIPNQNNMQQIPQQTTQMTLHAQMQQLQQGTPQHLQHIAVQQIPMSGVVVPAPQVIQTQNSQQQQYHLPTSQPMMQQGVQSQPNLMNLPQTQYFPSINSQMQGTSMGVQSITTNVLQSQSQPNPNLAMQQNYPVNPINQQMGVGHTIPPTSIPHLNQASIPTTTVPVMMSQQTPLTGIANLPIPVTQNTVISPQATSQGPALVQQQYLSQPVSSSIPLTLSSGGPQTYASSSLNGVPSIVDNIQVYPVDIPTEQSVVLQNQLPESFGDGTGEEIQQTEDAESLRGLALALATTSSFTSTTDTESPLPKTLNSNESSASGTSAVAIDNKIEQAMDLVKSHLMFAVREEVEVLKEKIAELMDRINQLEMENAVLKANASQETLSQLSSSLQPSPMIARESMYSIEKPYPSFSVYRS